MLPEESTIHVRLDTSDLSLVIAELNENRGFSFTIDGFYLRTISEDSLKCGEDSQLVTVFFHNVDTHACYLEVARNLLNELIFINEFLLSNFTHASNIVCGSFAWDEINAENSITINPLAKVVNVAAFKDMEEDTQIIHLVILDGTEFD